MENLQPILHKMQQNPAGVRFRDLARVGEAYFGAPRQRSGSHPIDRTPWPGDPRVNIQKDRGKAKAYQVRQVLQAIARLEAPHGTEQ